MLDAEIADLVAAQVGGKLTCREIATQVMERIARLDRRLKVFITVNEDVLAEADRPDEERRSGRVGRVHGIPIAVKDNIDTADMRTTGGSVVLAEMRARLDAPAVARLRREGALIVGKTNLDELAVAGSTISSILGQTLNPYDPSRFAPGSSGGSAVAVATMMAVIVGSDASDEHAEAAAELGPYAFDGIAAPEFKSKRIGILRNAMGDCSEHQVVNDVIHGAVATLTACGACFVEVDDGEFVPDRSSARLNVNNYEFRPLFDRYLAQFDGFTPVSDTAQYVSLGKYPATMETYLANAMAWENPFEMDAYRDLLANVEMHRKKVLDLMDRHERIGIYASAIGFPEINVPAGFTPPHMGAPIGLPVGIDLMSRPFADRGLLELAMAVESALEARRPPALDFQAS